MHHAERFPGYLFQAIRQIQKMFGDSQLICQQGRALRRILGLFDRATEDPALMIARDEFVEHDAGPFDAV